MQQQQKVVNIGIIGGGTVGGGVYKALQANGTLMSSRLGIRINVAKVAVRDLKKSRSVNIPAPLLTTDHQSLINDPEIHIIVELIGGTTTARKLVESALKAGKPVVTANKALLSKHGETLFALAKANKTNLYYEASVAGGIPIIKVLRESLIGNRVVRMYGIVNGTCNYILTRMKAEGADFKDVLLDAQKLGYAEAEPSLDVDGHDAAHKTGILASLAHGFWVNPQDIFVEGIRHIGKIDIQFATQLGYTIKLLGIVKCLQNEKQGKGTRHSVQVSVYPALLPRDHVMANVSGVYNAVLVRGDIVGDTLYYGRGAGQDATASSVLSDLADAALDLKCSSRNRVPAFVDHEKNGKVLASGDLVTRYYLRLGVSDKPGTLAKIATILAKLKIGISSVIQPEGHEGDTVPLILMIHDASNASMQKALQRIEKLPVVKGAPILIRVEDFE